MEEFMEEECNLEKEREREREPFVLCAQEEIVKNNQGIGVIELVLILVVLIGLVILFKDQVAGIMKTVFDKVNDSISKM